MVNDIIDTITVVHTVGSTYCGVILYRALPVCYRLSLFLKSVQFLHLLVYTSLLTSISCCS